jgi:hypothetical protein
MTEGPTAFEGIPVENVIRQVKLAIRQFIRESGPEDEIMAHGAVDGGVTPSSSGENASSRNSDGDSGS